MLYLELLIQGIVQGSLYGLMTLGLTLVYGLLRVLHVAHAGLFTLGGYVGVLVTNQTGSFALAILLAMIFVGICGMGIYKFAYEPILKRPPFVTLIASIALFIAMEEIFRIIFGPYGISYINPPLADNLSILGMNLKIGEVVVILFSLVMLLFLSWLSNHTRTGIAWRATVSDPDMAQAFGINKNKVRYLNFFVGSALTATAGVFVALLNNLVEPTMGAVPSYKGLAIIVLGGLGNIRGTLIASLLLGVVESYGTIYLGKVLDRDAIAFGLLIIILMVRPKGIMGEN
ncbi:MAG: branched-chain amino acid ABC transporter permease [Bdellovibrionota bacterium]|nr:branched-chain amino acid ABC transporter permease [Bdellovibrionota bacterium]